MTTTFFFFFSLVFQGTIGTTGTTAKRMHTQQHQRKTRFLYTYRKRQNQEFEILKKNPNNVF